MVLYVYFHVLFMGLGYTASTFHRTLYTHRVQLINHLTSSACILLHQPQTGRLRLPALSDIALHGTCRFFAVALDPSHFSSPAPQTRNGKSFAYLHRCFRLLLCNKPSLQYAPSLGIHHCILGRGNHISQYR